ncbi:redoxin family protein [Mucilaginibacter sabulilitoris]|uniref:Redoxin family protein n=1 Tax=Mucilaginibacter sabulilitoris TaxID=1173583 RepID=A0ABZ0TV45_9SPHI|nr:redoxin family protein [Mucilaginibacter sabulilitoris]WPU96971.1 redoxin family protein [Mucilaginibacter sabulilitoris]
MQKTNRVSGEKAPELNIPLWIDKTGKKLNKPILLADFPGAFIVLFCFQSWCRGCHLKGFPSLQRMTNALKGNDKVVFLAIQTVFEGRDINTAEKLIEMQKKYNLEIPFGQDDGDASTNNISDIMFNYRTGGTPWFIFIDKNRNIVFSDFHLNVENAIEFLENYKP